MQFSKAMKQTLAIVISSTHVVQPDHFIYPRIRSDLAFKVAIVIFTDVFRIEV